MSHPPHGGAGRNSQGNTQRSAPSLQDISGAHAPDSAASSRSPIRKPGAASPRSRQRKAKKAAATAAQKARRQQRFLKTGGSPRSMKAVWLRSSEVDYLKKKKVQPAARGAKATLAVSQSELKEILRRRGEEDAKKQLARDRIENLMDDANQSALVNAGLIMDRPKSAEPVSNAAASNFDVSVRAMKSELSSPAPDAPVWRATNVVIEDIAEEKRPLGDEKSKIQPRLLKKGVCEVTEYDATLPHRDPIGEVPAELYLHTLPDGRYESGNANANNVREFSAKVEGQSQSLPVVKFSPEPHYDVPEPMPEEPKVIRDPLDYLYYMSELNPSKARIHPIIIEKESFGIFAGPVSTWRRMASKREPYPLPMMVPIVPPEMMEEIALQMTAPGHCPNGYGLTDPGMGMFSTLKTHLGITATLHDTQVFIKMVPLCTTIVSKDSRRIGAASVKPSDRDAVITLYRCTNLALGISYEAMFESSLVAHMNAEIHRYISGGKLDSTTLSTRVLESSSSVKIPDGCAAAIQTSVTNHCDKIVMSMSGAYLSRRKNWVSAVVKNWYFQVALLVLVATALLVGIVLPTTMIFFNLVADVVEGSMNLGPTFARQWVSQPLSRFLSTLVAVSLGAFEILSSLMERTCGMLYETLEFLSRVATRTFPAYFTAAHQMASIAIEDLHRSWVDLKFSFPHLETFAAVASDAITLCWGWMLGGQRSKVFRETATYAATAAYRGSVQAVGQAVPWLVQNGAILSVIVLNATANVEDVLIYAMHSLGRATLSLQRSMESSTAASLGKMSTLIRQVKDMSLSAVDIGLEKFPWLLSSLSSGLASARDSAVDMLGEFCKWPSAPPLRDEHPQYLTSDIPLQSSMVVYTDTPGKCLNPSYWVRLQSLLRGSYSQTSRAYHRMLMFLKRHFCETATIVFSDAWSSSTQCPIEVFGQGSCFLRTDGASPLES